MKTITDQLFEAAGDLIKLLPEVSDPTSRYHMADDGGVETETGEFLYGLVRLLQPEFILETGTYTGISSMYMARALLDNDNPSYLVTLEVEQTHKDRAEKLWEKVGVSEVVKCILQPSLEFDFSKYDRELGLIFLDSEPEFRFKELVKFYPRLKPGGFFLVHDLHRHLSQQPNEEHFFGWPYSEIPDIIKAWIRSDKLRVVSFPTPRGLTMFYKPTEDDYSPDNEKFQNKEVFGLSE